MGCGSICRRSTGRWTGPGCHIKKGLIAQERQRPDLQSVRRNWIAHRQPRMAEQLHRLVFIDETSIKTNMTRLRGRAPVGERLFGTAPFGRWQTQTFVAGLTCNDLIAPWVISGAMDRIAFDTYIETQLAPVLQPGTVVILDNLATHKSLKSANLLKQLKC
jgi:DDE superfamily endonuclease